MGPSTIPPTAQHRSSTEQQHLQKALPRRSALAIRLWLAADPVDSMGGTNCFPLMSEKVEARLTMGNGAQFPVWPSSSTESRLSQGKLVRWTEVDFEVVAKDWDATLDRVKKAFDAQPN